MAAAAKAEHSEHSEQEGEGGAREEQKASKGEKKFKKAMLKAGSVAVEGVARVTLRTNKDMVMYIDRPTVLKTGEKENSYVVFGEPKFHDFNSQMAGAQARKFEEGATALKAEEKAPEIIKEEPFDEAAVEELRPEEGIREEDVTSMMDYTKCSRKMALHTLRQTGGDLVEAINKLT